MIQLTRHIVRYCSLIGIILGPAVSLFSQSFNILDIDLQDAALINGSLIVVSENGSIFTSPENSENFTLRREPPEGNSEFFFDLSVDGITAIAVGSDGLIVRSSDSGVSWAGAASPSIVGDLLGVDSGSLTGAGQTWVAVGNTGGNGAVFSSTDNGLNWQETASVKNVTFSGVVWTGSRWLACGASDFQEGVIYQSTDRVNWTPVTVPEFTEPLLRLATDGSGTVVAVGESGAIVRSTDDGVNFSQIGAGEASGDLTSVSWDGFQFLIGGDERLVLSLDGTTLNVELPEGPGAPPVKSLVSGGTSLFIAGAFEPDTGFSEIPLLLQIESSGNGDLTLTLAVSDPKRVYYLEESTDLENWSRVPDSLRAGNGGALTWSVSSQIQKFWRVSEP